MHTCINTPPTCNQTPSSPCMHTKRMAPKVVSRSSKETNLHFDLSNKDPRQQKATDQKSVSNIICKMTLKINSGHPTVTPYNRC